MDDTLVHSARQTEDVAYEQLIISVTQKAKAVDTDDSHDT